jgi:predicted extracellular nuclease
MRKLILLTLCAAAFALTVHDIQYSTDGASPYDGEIITVSAVVVATGYSGDKYFIGDPGGGPWSGVYVYGWTFTGNPGDWVTITAEVDEYYGLTELKNVSSITIDSVGVVPPAYPTTCAVADTSEALEGVLVTLSNLVVTHDTSNVWVVSDGTGELIVAKNFGYSFNPSVGDTITSLTGLMQYEWNEFRIEPRFNADIEAVADTSDTTEPGDVYTIAQLQANPSAFDGMLVTVEGVVTVGASLVDNSRLKAYVQDTSGEGIQLYNASIPANAGELVRGAYISVTGTVDEYLGNLELVSPTWTVLSTGHAIPEPVDAFSESNPENRDGTWMSLCGRVASKTTYSDAANIYVSRGGRQLLARVWASTGIDLGGVSVGDSILIEGVSTVYSGSFQLLPAYQDDIVVIGDTTTPPDTGLVPIANIQTNYSTYSGQTVTCRGVITISAGAIHGTQLKAYLQDASGMGIQLFGYSMTAAIESLMVRGNVIQVTGQVTEYGGITEIVVSTWSHLGTDTLPTPLALESISGDRTAWEGTWIELEGKVVDKYSAGGGLNLMVDISGNLTDIVEVRAWETTGITSDAASLGDLVIVRGVGGIYSSAFQLLPGHPDDIDTFSVSPSEGIMLEVEKGVLVTSNNEKIEINFSVPTEHRAILRVFDRMGRESATLFDNTPVGQVKIDWDGRDETGQFLRHGAYMLHLQSVSTSGERESETATIAIGSILK